MKDEYKNYYSEKNIAYMRNRLEEENKARNEENGAYGDWKEFDSDDGVFFLLYDIHSMLSKLLKILGDKE